ncbi:MAG TPA: response regulator transcription factor [Hyphomicrobiaceae bacterium]|jgi:DNA-binding response OmpR family regulator|nr:response regulator transcription factor [Hyphomicrobiaceae bacterium]
MDTPDATRPADGRIVYVVEDHEEIGRLVCTALDRNGFRSEHFKTGTSFLQYLKRKAPAISVIDLGLPDLDGLHLVRQVQAISDSAILILTGRDSVDDRILGLELGADDYMVKPFEPREVVARVNTILRRLERSGGPRQGTGQTARFSGWTFEESRNRLTAPEGREVELSAAEARLLGTLLRQPNRILNRAALLGDADREPLDRSIDARISRLRRKLQVPDDGPELIKTVYGAGYMLVAKVEWD